MVSVPLGTRIGQVFSYYSLQSQILDFIYPTMFYGLLHQPQVYTLKIVDPWPIVTHSIVSFLIILSELKFME